MTQYRKKPVVIDAMQFTGKNAADVIEWVGPKASSILSYSHAGEVEEVEIETLEGTMHASPGDWIIRGIKGEYYPIKPGIFAATYEAAE
jgi:hypothetical protein